MIGVHNRISIFAFCEPVDMRKGFEGLSALAREEMGRDPVEGGLFLFTNRRRTHAKVLHFDGTGLCLFAKRLERGRFVALWKFVDHRQIKLTKAELELFLQGSHLIARFRLAPAPLSEKELEVGSQM